MKAGKEYELLVEKLYKTLAPDAIIKQDDYIYGHTSKAERQIDVSIRYKYAGVDNLIIVQVKDLGRKADVNVVGTFDFAIKDVMADKGVLICAKGFTKAALEAAKGLRIECLTLHSAEKKNWAKEIQILTVREEDLFDFSYKVGFSAKFTGNSISLPSIPLFSFDEGKSVKRIGEIIYDYLITKKTQKEVCSGKRFELKITDDVWLYHFGIWLKLLKLEITTIHIKKIKCFRYFTPHNYLYTVDHLKNQINIQRANFENVEYFIDDKEWKRFNNSNELPIVVEKQTHRWHFIKFTDGLYHVSFGVDKLDHENTTPIDLGIDYIHRKIMEQDSEIDGGLKL